MRGILVSSIRFRLAVIAIAAAVVYLGIDRLQDTPVDVLPEYMSPRVEIQTEALGLSAAEVEQLITVPLEADLLNGSAWLETIRSESVPGLSSIEMIFEPGTDIMRARQMVQERLTQAHALPQVSKPPQMLQPLSSTNRLMTVGLTSKDLSLIQMSVLARWTIKPRLMGVPGVANVAIWGQRERQLQVQVDPKKLQEKGVSLNQVIATTGNSLWVSHLTFLEASVPGTGGFIDTPNQRLGIRHVLPISSAEQLAQVTVEDAKMPLSEVATVVEDHQPLIGDAITGSGPGLVLVVEKFPGASALEVTKGVEEALDALRPGLAGVQIDAKLYRPANYLEASIANLSKALLIGGVLAALALLAFLFDMRAAVVACIAIPLSLFAAALVLSFMGATINAMVIAGLAMALAVVVDDAVIDVESIKRRLHQHSLGGSGKSSARIILDAVFEMRSAVGYATVITLLATLPVFFLGGVWGELFGSLGYAFVVAVLTSMVVALTVTPALSVMLFSKGPYTRREAPFLQSLQSGFDSMLAGAAKAPGKVWVAAAVVAGASLATLAWLQPPTPLPTFKERDLLVHVDANPGTSRPAMNRIATQMTKELKSVPGIRDVNAIVGRAIMSDQVVGMNSGQIWVSLEPSADYDKTVDAIKETVNGYPGFDCDVLTYATERVTEALDEHEMPLTVRVYGQDLDMLRKEADKVKELLAGVKGVVDPRVDLPVMEPTVEVEVDLALAEKHNIKPGDVRRAASTLLSGIEVGSLYEKQKVFEVVVWGAPGIRHSLNSISDLLIDQPGGGHVRLGDVAEVRIKPSPNIINREGVFVYLDVNANLNKSLSSVSSEIKSRLKETKFPMEYRAEVLGASAKRETARVRVLVIAVACAIGIYLLLQVAVRSWSLAAAAFVALPFAIVGGLPAALATGGVVTVGSMVGFFAVGAIAVRQALLLIHRYRHLQQHEGAAFGAALVERGTKERFAPIVTTAITTAVAVAPLAYFGNLPGAEIVYPMAVVLLGGLVTATLLNLFVVPALYLQYGAAYEPELELLPSTIVSEEEQLNVSAQDATWATRA